MLKRGGILLLSVPYFSPMRRALAVVIRREWRRRQARASGSDGAPTACGQFYQYAYTVREFERFLTSAGFRVIGSQGYAILWGLYDVGA